MSQEMTAEEIRARLAEAGLLDGEWGHREESKVGQPPYAKKLREGAEVIRDMLEEQVRKDKQALAEAVEALARLEHGGASARRAK